ncbi:hypothetical protein CCACVL1_23625 [Corchorus capsularis]|uniref:Uncharacterized protein n=1 Tax=Corchorus capsularis TaxID=210143 RepID=A0A1R3GT93_COCAP|nr:hypothetical protein CCACVL1_23625 [Corchorus capsularis]
MERSREKMTLPLESSRPGFGICNGEASN